MKKTIMITVILLTALVSFCKDNKPVRDASEKLLDLINMDQTFDKSINQAMQMPLNMIDAQDISDEEKKRARQNVEASMKVTLDKFSWENIKPLFIDIYSEVLTLEELTGLISFYESPIGRKFIKKQPELTKATMKKMQGLMQELMPEIQKETAASIAKAKEMERNSVEDALLEGEQ